MIDGLPAPMVPAEVDLRDFAFMPLDVVRLRDSGLTAKASGDEFRAAVLLWCASWHQVPAASLPDDDDELANICGYSRARREWNKIAAGARRGWVKCSDGRLYHDRVAAKALEAWIEKLASAIGGAVGNAKRWNVVIDTDLLRAQFAAAVPALRLIDPQSRTLRKKVVAVLTMPSRAESPPDSPGESPPDSPPDRKGQGQGQGQGQGSINTTTSVEVVPLRPSPDGDGQQLALVDPPPETPGPYEPPECPHQAVLALWAEVLPAMPQHQPQHWDGTRAGHLRARWRETAVAKRWPDQAAGLLYLRRLFAHVGRSQFLTGRAPPLPGKRPFQIELEWLVSPGNWARVHEGKYHQED